MDSMTSSSETSCAPSLYNTPTKLKFGDTLRPQLKHLPVSSASSATSASTHTPKVLVVEGGPFNFTAPGIEEDKIRERIMLTAKPVEAYMNSDDGEQLVALPLWLRFDNKALEFWGVPVLEDEDGPKSLAVSVWQGEAFLSAFVMEIEAR